MLNIADIIAVGLAAGFVQEYEGANRDWLQVIFPDGSWEIMPETGMQQKHQAMLLHAHHLWSARAIRRMAAEGIAESIRPD